jgi:hypothetical protein
MTVRDHVGRIDSMTDASAEPDPGENDGDDPGLSIRVWVASLVVPVGAGLLAWAIIRLTPGTPDCRFVAPIEVVCPWYRRALINGLGLVALALVALLVVGVVSLGARAFLRGNS